MAQAAHHKIVRFNIKFFLMLSLLSTAASGTEISQRAPDVL
jgi:hypothetical protein